MTTADSDNEPTASPASTEAETTAATTNTGTAITEMNSADRPQAGDASAPGGPTSSPPSPSSPPRRTGAWLAWTAFIVLIAALGAGGYFAWSLLQDYQQRFQTLEQNNQRQQQQLNNGISQLQQLQQTIAEQQRALAGAEENQRALRTQLRAQSDSIRALSTTTTDDWKLAEAHYLTRLASQRIAMERNTQGALALLQAADDIVNRHLQNHAEPALTDVRRQLAQDIVSLKVAGAVDREGMFFAINAVVNKISQLPQGQLLNYHEQQRELTDAEDATEAINEVPQMENENGIWQRIQQSFGGALAKSKDFIRVSHHDQPLAAIPTPNQQELLIYRVQTLLLSAQLALLREQPRIFSDSLQQAAQLLENHYPLTDNPLFQQVKGIIETLRSLQAQSIVQELPDISQSQQQLGDYLDRLHRVGANTESQSPPQNQQPQATEESSQPSATQDAPL